nr:protease domain-containing protein [Lysobacter sp.]
MGINRKKWATAVGLSALVAIAGATAIKVSGGAGIPGLTTTSASAGQGNAGAGNSGKGAPPVTAGSDGMEQVATQHIIVFHEAALAGYEGERAGLPAPPRVAGAKGKRRIDVKSAQARNYVKFLQQAQAGHEAKMAKLAGRPLKVRLRMQHALNGMVAELTADEAARIARLPEVALVEDYREYTIHSDTGPIHIGAGPVWAGTNPGASAAFQGEGVVVGILDTGINFGSPSFTAVDPIDGYQ